MSKHVCLKRVERLLIMMKLFVENPGKLFNIKYFQTIFQLAKSTLSEDFELIDHFLTEHQEGTLFSVQGASGGIRYVPEVTGEEKKEIVSVLMEELAKPDRIMQGGFLYTSDIVFDPKYAELIGKIFYDQFRHLDVDFVATMETKGIPMALMTAKYFNLPLLTIRKESRVTEGPSVSINYLSGSTGKIFTMSLPKNALKPGKKILFIDDFMKAGGTTSGVKMLIEQFGCTLAGTGVMMVMDTKEEKLVDDYFAILTLEDIDVKNKCIHLKSNISGFSLDGKKG